MRLDATESLLQARHGDGKAEAKLWPLIYDKLRALAALYLRRDPSNRSLEPTALVHEVYLKLVDQSRVDWDDRTRFLSLAAQAMRRVLVDQARRRRAGKRGGNRQRLTLAEATAISPERDVDVEALDEALGRLSALHSRQGRVVELRFFGGMTVEQVAESLGVSTATAENDWRVARAWLRRELSKEERP